MRRIAAVLWSGLVGGAETFTADLCRTLREIGSETGVVFVTDSEPLATRLDADGIPHTSLGLARGREVLSHPRSFAKAVQSLGRDGVLLLGSGFLAAALRAGGYRGRVVAVMHGATVELGPTTLRDRLVIPVDRAMGFWASDVDVAVSDFSLAQIRRHRRRAQLVRIYNGVDLEKYTPDAATTYRKTVTIAYAGRLIEGKGVDVLLRAMAAGAATGGVRLRIGGDGPARPMLENLSAKLGLNPVVEFTGWISDMPSFWRACEVAVMPSDRCVESFGMAAVEAMACGIPVVVTENGALPELIDQGVTGSMVPRGDVGALADALVELTRDVDKRRSAGSASRARCEQQFDIRDCAQAYLALFEPR